jgi:hypothetical protein
VCAALPDRTQSSKFAAVTAKITGALRSAEVHTFVVAGHIPHVTPPGVYTELTTGFIPGHSS